MNGAVGDLALTAAQEELVRRAEEIDLSSWAVDEASGLWPISADAAPVDEMLAARIAAAAGAARQSAEAARHDGLYAVPDKHAVIVIDLAGADADDPAAARNAKILANYWTDLASRANDCLAIDGFNQQLSQSYEEVNLIYRMAKLLTSSAEPSHSVQRICDELRATLGYGWLAMIFHTSDGVLDALRGRVLRSGAIPFSNEVLAGELLTFDPAKLGKVLTAAAHPLAAQAGCELLAEPVLHDGRHDGAPIGLLIAGDRRGDVADVSSNEIQLVSAAAGFLGLFHENAFRFSAQQQQFFGTLHALSATVDAKDPYTAGHSQRVGLLGSQLAQKLGMPPDEIDALRIAGLLHDIGKIGVPEAVLRKPAKLDDAEFAMIQKHPEIGYEILKDIPSLAFHLPGVLYHHERWDGRGYPHRLAGEKIPIIARILALADTFDAMSSNRAYRKGMERARVFDEMRKSSGVQFDPALVEPFLAMDFKQFDLLNQ